MTQIENGESGLSVRNKLNAALATQAYATRAAFIAATVPSDTQRTAFIVNGQSYAVIRDAAGPIAQSNGQTWRPDGDVMPQHFGAVGDGVADDSAAINLAFDYLRSSNNEATLLRPAMLSGGKALFRVNSSINATKITLGKGWGIRDMWIIGRCAGKTILDLTGSRFGYFENLNIYGGAQFDAANDPHTGILIACADDPAVFPCDTHTFVNCSVDGYYSHSSYTEYASEQTSHTSCLFWNRRVASGSNPCYAGVLQGRPTIPMVSDFQTISVGRASYTAKHYDRCLFQKPFGIAGPTLYIEDLASTKFTKPYFANGFGAAVEWKLNDGFLPYAITFEGLQIETAGTDTSFMFTGSGDRKILGLSVSFGNTFTSEAVFDVNGPTSVNLSDLKLDIPRWNGSSPTNVFANTSLFRLSGAAISVPALTDLEDYTSFNPASEYTVYAHEANVRRAFGSLRVAQGPAIIGGGQIQSGAGELMADDTVVSLDLSDLGIVSHGKLDFWSTSAGIAGTIFYRADASPIVISSTVGANVTVVTATTLGGTTGTDGRFTVAINNGQIQFENRFGFNVNLRRLFTTFTSGV